MSRHRFYAPPEDIKGQEILLSADETHHLARVLRLHPGDQVFVFDGGGSEYNARILSIEGKRANLEIVEPLSDPVESSLALTLAQALAKGDKFDLIVQKSTELGVTRIIPLITEQADVKPDAERIEKRIARWRRISLEAVKQSKRRRLVEIQSPLALGELLGPGIAAGLDSFSSKELWLAFSERGGRSLQALASQFEGVRTVTAIVGPEGGWSDSELALMTGSGCLIVTLGPRILRTETAAIAGVALIQSAFGDIS
jgi:16S rRNA (uracil1498-N3)-methyltransferase